MLKTLRPNMLPMNIQLFAESKQLTLEEMQIQFLEIKKENETLSTQVTQLTEQSTEKDKYISKLKETNNELFVQATTKTPEKGDEGAKEEIPSCLDEKTYKLLSKSEKQILEEILMGDDE